MDQTVRDGEAEARRRYVDLERVVGCDMVAVSEFDDAIGHRGNSVQYFRIPQGRIEKIGYTPVGQWICCPVHFRRHLSAPEWLMVVRRDSLPKWKHRTSMIGMPGVRGLKSDSGSLVESMVGRASTPSHFIAKPFFPASARMLFRMTSSIVAGFDAWAFCACLMNSARFASRTRMSSLMRSRSAVSWSIRSVR